MIMDIRWAISDNAFITLQPAITANTQEKDAFTIKIYRHKKQ